MASSKQKKHRFIPKLLASLLLLVPSLCFADSGYPVLEGGYASTYGIIAAGLFILAYIAVMTEEFTHLKKSKPVIFASGFIWILVSLVAQQSGQPELAKEAIKHNILEFSELFLFLLIAMTYINAMEERQVFNTMRQTLVNLGYSFRTIYWITGILAFFISAIADNLTTAILMCAVIMAVGRNNARFISLSCINLVNAANAGGAFSPFGDITTLMVWQSGILPFFDFFHIFLPSVVNFLIPALCIYPCIQKGFPATDDNVVTMEKGAKRIILLFIATLATAVSFQQFFGLPPVAGMMMGLGYLQLFGYYLFQSHTEGPKFDIFEKIRRAEWDTLLFFYGVLLCVGGLATLGYLSIISDTIYGEWGSAFSALHQATPANVFVGFLSAIVDNIPVMFSILSMHPDMSTGQWLLVTLTAGVGGSMLSIGSAAGVALMGQAKGYYTFFGHLKWTWAILLGYIASVGFHIWWNEELFSIPIGV